MMSAELGEPGIVLSRLTAGAERHLGDLASASLRELVATIYGDDPALFGLLSFAEAGQLLSTTLIPLLRSENATGSSLRLLGVALHAAGAEVQLSPGEALAHPLLRDWLGSTWADHVARLLAAGATLSFAAPGAPQADLLEVTDQDGRVAAQVTLRFSGASAIATYGEALATDTLTCAARVTGEHIRAIGAEARASVREATVSVEVSAANTRVPGRFPDAASASA